jgi:hypothetical protein
VVTGCLEYEQVIEGGHPQHHARRQPQAPGDVHEDVVREVSEHVLSDVQGLDELILGMMDPLDVLVHDGETLVPRWM